MRDILGYNKEVEFVLDSKEQGTALLDKDPKNWNSDEKTYQRDKESGGVLRKVNTKLEFTKNAYDYLFGSTLVYGLNPEISVTKLGKDVTDKHETWRRLYHSFLDMPRIEFDEVKKIAKVPFTQGGLFDRIKSRFSDKYDLTFTKDADGNDIGELKTIIEQVPGREIFRRSTGTVEDGVSILHIVTGADKDNARGVVFTVKPNSDIDNINNVTVGTEAVPYNNDDYATGAVGSLLFTRSDRHRERKLNGKIKVSLDPIKVHPGYLRLDKVFYQYNTSNNKYEFQGKKTTLAEVDTNVQGNVLEYDFVNHEIILEKDEACALVLYSHTDNGIGYTYTNTKVIITEDDSYPSTEAKDLLPFEMIERLLEKETGESGLLISNVLGRTDLGYSKNGDWSLLAVSSGFWARGFDKQFTISLKDALDSINVMFPIMWTIEKRQGKEYFRLEKYEYTQQPFVGVKLGRTIQSKFIYTSASKPTRTILTKNLYTGCKIGFEKGGKDYEEVSGLSSPHGVSEYNTSYWTEKENNYIIISKIRGDVEGYDLARRKQAEFYPDEDTPYDQDLFFRHLKKVGAQYFLRTWQDDLVEQPKGENIYSPDTMGNLLLTPFRCLKRHSKLIAVGIYKEPYKTLNWISSNCYSELITKISGEEELAENGSIENIELGKPYTSEYLLKFNGKVFQEMIDQIEGFTTVNGEKIPNWYGKYEVNVNGYLQQGKLVKVEINGEGKHEIALIP